MNNLKMKIDLLGIIVFAISNINIERESERRERRVRDRILL